MGKNKRNKRSLNDTSSSSSSSGSAHKKKKSWSPSKAKIRELTVQLEAHKQALVHKDRLIAQKDLRIAEIDRRIAEKDQRIAEKDQRIAEKDLLIAEKDVRITEKDKLIEIQDQIFNELKTNSRAEIVRLSTELAFKEGFLNNRGMIEQFEYRYSTEREKINNPTRYQLWRTILQKPECEDIQRFLSRRTSYPDISSASSAIAIVHAYDLLSRQVHQEVNRTELIIADNLLRKEQSIILGLIAFKLNIKFHSRWIDLRTIEEFLRPTRRSQHISL